MKNTFYTFLLTGAALLPLTAQAQTLPGQVAIAQQQYVMAQNLTTPELNAIKEGRLTNNGQPIPVETQIMMSTGNLDGYTIRKIQQSLAERGYYKGQVNGTWDSATASSLLAFQTASGDKIDPTGKLIASGTLARLGVTMDKLTAGDANSRVSTNPDLSKETRGLADSKMSHPGQTVPAPDNGTKSTMTRDAVATGQFNKTIDGSTARGSTDAGSGQKGTTAQDNAGASVAGTRSAPSVVGNSSLSAGATSSATVPTTGSLQATSTPGNSGSLSGNGTAANNVDGRPGPGSPPTTSSAVGGRTAGSLSNSTATAATGSGIAASGGALSDGSSTTSSGSSLSGSSGSSASSSGSLSGGSSGGGGGGGGGF